MTNNKLIALRLYFAIGLLMFSYGACSQTTIDSLKNELNKATNTSSVDLLNDISKLYQYTAPDSSMLYASQAETKANELKYRPGQVAAIKNKGNYYVRIGDFEKAIIEYDRALVIYTEENDKDGIQKILNNKGHAYRVSGDYDQATCYVKTVTIAKFKL